MARFERIQTQDELINRIQSNIEEAFVEITTELRTGRTSSSPGVINIVDAPSITSTPNIDVSEFSRVDHEHDLSGVIPIGGDAGQILAKRSDRDNDVEWREFNLEIGGQRIPSSDFYTEFIRTLSNANITIPVSGTVYQNPNITDQTEDDETRFLLDSNNNTIFAFNIRTQSYDQPKDIRLDSSNQSPYGITYFNDEIYVTEEEKNIRVYNRDSGFLNLNREVSLFRGLDTDVIDISVDSEFIYLLYSDRVDSIPLVFKNSKVQFDLPSGVTPVGIHYFPNRGVFVIDSSSNKILLFNRVSGQKISEIDLNRRNSGPQHISANGLNNLYVLDSDKYFVYDLDGRGTRMYPLAASNRNPSGIYANNQIVYVSDSSDEIAYSYREVDGSHQTNTDISIGDSDAIGGNNDRIFKLDKSNNIISVYNINDSILIENLKFDFLKQNLKPRGLFNVGRLLYCVDEDNYVFAYNIETSLYLPFLSRDLSDFSNNETYLSRTLGISRFKNFIFVSGETELNRSFYSLDRPRVITTGRTWCYNDDTKDRIFSKDFYSPPRGIFIRDTVTWFVSNSGINPAYSVPDVGSHYNPDKVLKDIVRDHVDIKVIREDSTSENVNLIDGFISARVSGGDLILGKTPIRNNRREQRLTGLIIDTAGYVASNEQIIVTNNMFSVTNEQAGDFNWLYLVFSLSGNLKSINFRVFDLNLDEGDTSNLYVDADDHIVITRTSSGYDFSFSPNINGDNLDTAILYNTKGVQGDQGRQGNQGIQGVQGLYRLEVFTWVNSGSTAPVTPTGGSWNHRTSSGVAPTKPEGDLTTPNDWSFSFPSTQARDSTTYDVYITFAIFNPRYSSLGSWSIPYISGAQGPTGPQGPRGFTGLAGEDGRDGRHGEQGFQGKYRVDSYRAVPKGNPTPTAPTGGSISASPTGWAFSLPSDQLDQNRFDLYQSFIIHDPANNSFEGSWSDPILIGGLVGPTGPAGPQGPQGLQGPRGETGIMGTVGVRGLQGEQGEKGDTGPVGPAGGPQGIQGERGLQGAQGPQGLQGEKGDKGDKGDDGSRGPRGETGDTGAQGLAGARGPQGIQGNRGLQGEAGSQGSQGVYDIKVFTVVAHNATAPSTPTATSFTAGTRTFVGLTSGWSVSYPSYNPATQDVYESFVSYNPSGSSLGNFATPFEIGAEVGPAGPSGPAGSDGARGPAGAKGDTGDQGIQGIQGPQGEAGSDGTDGVDGARGLRGAIGPAGAQGERGEQGTQGPKGDKGDTGDRGEQGLQGDRGNQGEKGDTGDTGAIGPAGPQGEQGVQGIQGEVGLQGPAGTDGADGARGPIGPAGTDGADGARGPAGTDGARGPIGPAGVTGPQGSQGLYDIKVFRVVAHDATAPSKPTASSFTAGTRAFVGLTSGWSTDYPSFNPSTQDVYESFVSYNPSGNSLGTFATPFEVGAEIGPAGPSGPAGSDGARGPAGEKGDKGDTGATGPAGTDGADGARGPTGAQGDRGPQGLQGDRGPAGAQGNPGARGTQGPQGPAGVDGADGARGPTGAKGDKGDTGATGPAGPAGGIDVSAVGTGLTLDSGTLNITNPFTEANETKLDGIETSATADQTAVEIRDSLITLTDTNRLPATAIRDLPTGNVQSDWVQTNTTTDDFIKNKPTNIIGFDYGLRDSSEDFDTLTVVSNDNPYGLWSDGITIYVSDSLDGKIYAYNLSTKARDSSKDFDTLRAAGNNHPTGIWSDKTTMWVADNNDDKIYAYKISDKLRDVSKDFNTLTRSRPFNNSPTGMWSDGTTMWVADNGSLASIYAYNLSTKERDPSKDFNGLRGAGNTDPIGIWSDGMTMWVADGTDDKIYAYNVSTKNHDSSKDFDTLDATGNNSPTGLWSDGTTMWVGDGTDNKIYAYTILTNSLNANVVRDSLVTLTGDDRLSATAIRNLSSVDETNVQSDWFQNDNTKNNYIENKPTDIINIIFGQRNSSQDFNISIPGLSNILIEIYGLWSDGVTIWCANRTSTNIYAYNLITKARDPSKDFNITSSTIVGFSGLWSDGTTMWVADEALQKIYAYVLSTKARDSGKDFNTLDANHYPYGLWSDGTTLWSGSDNNIIYAYNLITKERDAAKDLNISRDIQSISSRSPYITSVWSDGTTIWVTVTSTSPELSQILAYNLNTKEREPEKELHTLVAAGNDDPSAIWGNSNIIWVADSTDDKVYAYNLYKNSLNNSEVKDSLENISAKPFSGIRDSSEDFDTLSAAGNNNPEGIWSNGITMWVIDPTDVKIYAYVLSTKARDSSKDFDTLRAAGNISPAGLWSDGTTMWVSDNTFDTIYAYVLATKARDSSKDFNTLSAAGNNNPEGIWSDGTTMYVLDNRDAKIYAYKMSDKSRDSEKDFNLLRSFSNSSPYGIWSDGITMWVSDYFLDKIFAYNFNTKTRDFSKDLNILGSSGNNDPRGIFSDGTTMWVADITDDKIYAYNLFSNDNRLDSSAIKGLLNQSATEVRDSLVTLTGTDRLPATAIRDLPTGSGSGLSTVSSDTTITGTGVTTSPLSVANPFTEADETKLDGIEVSATADQTAVEIRDSLVTLTGTARLPATAIRNLSNQTATEVKTSLETLTEGNKLSTTAIQDLRNISDRDEIHLDNITDVINFSDGTSWTQVTPNPIGFTTLLKGFSLIVYDNKMWIMGGTGASIPVRSSSDGITWTQTTNSPGWSGRKDHTSVVYNNRMWVIGGDQGSREVWSSTDGITWTRATASAAFPGRRGHTSVVFDNKMWVMGGRASAGSTTDYNDVWSSSDGITWTQATASAGWSARDNHASVVFDNKIWVMGGRDGAGSSTNHNDVWSSTDGITWTQATASAGWSGRSFLKTLNYNNRMWVIGGYTGPSGSTLSDVWSSTDGITWTRATTTAASSLARGYGAVVYDNKMWIMGGDSRSSSSRFPVWSSDVEDPNFTFSNRYVFPATGIKNSLETLTTTNRLSATAIQGLPPTLPTTAGNYVLSIDSSGNATWVVST